MTALLPSAPSRLQLLRFDFHGRRVRTAPERPAAEPKFDECSQLEVAIITYLETLPDQKS